MTEKKRGSLKLACERVLLWVDEAMACRCPETETEWLGKQSVAGAPPFSAASEPVTLNYKDSGVGRPDAARGNRQASVVHDFVTLRTTSPPTSSLNFLYIHFNTIS